MALEKSSLDLKKLSLREIVIIGVTLSFAVGYGYYKFEYTTQNKKLENLTKQITQTQASVGAFKKILIDPTIVKKTEAEIEKVKLEVAELYQAIEQGKIRLQGQDTEFLNEIQEIAEANEVFLKSLRSSERFVKRGIMRLKEVSLIMEMEGEYTALKNFVDSLGTFPAVLHIESLEAKRNEKILPKIESRLHLKVLVL